MIIVSSDTGLAAMRAAIKERAHDIIVICEDDTTLFCGHPLGNIGEAVAELVDIKPERCTNFRGGSRGSRGKGGKIKYTRK